MKTATKKFTPMECLIIVIMLGICSSVLMPRLSQAASEARTADLCESLHKVRNAITLYKINHKNQLPGSGKADWLVALTSSTTTDGNLFTASMAGNELRWGPYLDKVPMNVFNNKKSVRVDGPPAGTGTHGWRFDSTTGEFQADDMNPGHDML